MAACLGPKSGIHSGRKLDRQRSISSAFELDVAGLEKGTGQWENMQEVVRRCTRAFVWERESMCVWCVRCEVYCAVCSA